MARSDPGIAGGLYDPTREHDACGVGMVADLEGRPSHRIVEQALLVLERLAHRGASGAEVATGDGSGILVQVPHRLLADEAGVDLPGPGRYATGMAFLPRDADDAAKARAHVDAIADEEGLAVLGWREVPVDRSTLGETALRAQPRIEQVFLARRAGAEEADPLAIDRVAFVVRKRVEHAVDGVYFPSLSARTLVYKGMLTSHQLREFYPELGDERVESGLSLVHSRFSTNTFPSWPLAHPYRYLAHNGEINTLAGNRNWMRAREALLRTDLIDGDLSRAYPICTPGASDSASFDEVLELLHLGGRSLPHAVLMMIPEAWENHTGMDPARRAFYRYHASLMEPWDGPAAVAFTDGTVVGAVLDRNGLRPARYWVTDDGLVVLASEVGVLDLDPARVVRKGRLQPGRMFLVDTSRGRIVDDDEIKAELAGEHPYAEWLARDQVRLEDLPPRAMLTPQHASVVTHQRLFGYTTEELRVIVGPMAQTGAEPVGSMGSDAAVAVLSERSRLLYDYFTQLFAQVTNPPLDAIREELVTSLAATVGPEGNLLATGSCRQIVLPQPVIEGDDLAKLMYVNEYGETPGFKAFAIDGLFPVATAGDVGRPTPEGGRALAAAIDNVRTRVSAAIADGANLIVLSDRNSTTELAPIPSLLLVAAVHHHLVRERTRTKVGLVVETGDAREVHHMALLIGYGAAAVNPYLALQSVDDMIAGGQLEGVSPRQAHKNYVKAACKGVLKVMSKMGISTVASYTGAQVFEAIGLDRSVVDEYFTGTASRIGGVGTDVLAAEVAARHRLAHLDRPTERAHRELEGGGEYQWRREGEYHLFNPKTVFKLQHATRAKRYEIFKEYSAAVDDQSERLATLRGLLRLRPAPGGPVPLEEVEPVSAIVRRFSTGAMSYGSISAEAHENLAIAMNRIGGRSNTGEGGEDPARFVPDADGDLRRSAVKQVASGRFGVTGEYLANADDIQIKISQGAKPGEGGQLPGHKVYPWIARTRFSTPGVGLISPPPHHDIYSIEDIAQLIHDLKSANPRARVHVKLVAEVGVGTVAAGVAKAHSDVVLISGHDGGTGAAPLTSLKHAGIPWELGLAETQQTLMANGLRDRIVVQVDGQMKTGRDVVVGALLGAEEYGFATAPLVVSGCIMMRVCHLDTCPVGIATQNPELRKRFNGRPEFVTTYFEYVAEEVREHLAALGLRSLEEAVGRTDLLDAADAVRHWKAAGLDLGPVLTVADSPYGTARHQVREQDHGLDLALDHRFLPDCEAAIADGTPVSAELAITNVDRTVGTLLGSEISRRRGAAGLPDGTITLTFRGSAGQSFGAFVPRGVTMRLYGDANDYFGKGLSGGRLVLAPPETSPFAAEEQIIAGNVILYGATGGEAFVRGQVGERFCVRNSGATAVVEGVGDHGCEYMTGGTVVVLGPTGRNFGAGMSGGVAYVYDPDRTFARRVNPEMVDAEPLGPGDREWLAGTVRRHLEETGSAVAGRLLDGWERALEDMVKVMPRDYRRVLEATARAVEEGRPVDEAVMARVGKPTGFLEHGRELPRRRPIPVRLRDWREVYEPFPAAATRAQGARCMDCGIPFCHEGCPLGNLIPEWNDLVYRDDWSAAVERLHATNNFPEFTGRLCPAPCEAACVLGINADPVTIERIEYEIAERGWGEGWVRPQVPRERTGKRVAVVGSGPAGLAAAQQLARAGHSVVVYERAERPGGLLRYGIPEFKMEKRILDRRLAQLRAEGVRFRCSTSVGEPEVAGAAPADVAVVPTRALVAEHDAVVLAGGATLPRDLEVPGRSLGGVHFALEYLKPSNLVQEGVLASSPVSARGRHVVIIGGGDTGADCLGTAHRQGAASVHQLEIMPEPPSDRSAEHPWPIWPVILRTSSAHEEGGRRLYSVTTTELVDDGSGAVRALRGHQVAVGPGPTFTPVAGSDFELPCDLVLLAMGFVGSERRGVVAELGLELDRRGSVLADGGWSTNVEGVFVCGDMTRGQSLIVWAIAEGRSAAAAADRWLMGETALPAPISPGQLALR